MLLKTKHMFPAHKGVSDDMIFRMSLMYIKVKAMPIKLTHVVLRTINNKE